MTVPRTTLRARLRDRMFRQLRREDHLVQVDPAALSIDAAGLWRVSFPAAAARPFLAAVHDRPELGHERIHEIAAWAEAAGCVRFRIYVEMETQVSPDVM